MPIHTAPDSARFLTPDGHPFFCLGVNYEGYFDRAWKMWDEFDPALIEKDFRKAGESGFRVVRIFVQSALADDIQAGDFSKLDTVLNLAHTHNLYVLLTLNDEHRYNLVQVGDLDAQIAGRYADETVIMGYDLENEPAFRAIVSSQYPSAYQPPAQTAALVDHYGEQKSRAEVEDWRQVSPGSWLVPSYVPPEMGYFCANAYFLYLDFLKVATNWVRENGGIILDYITSPASEHWRFFLEVFSDTLQAWIEAQTDPIRAVDPRHLITVGHNNLLFASLPANASLDFGSFHYYSVAGSMWGLERAFEILEKLRAIFPGQPYVFEEFGYSNATSSQPEHSTPVDTALTSIYETAIYLYLKTHNFGGGFKWMLNDLLVLDNPYEGSFGVFQVGDRPKPIGQAVDTLAAYWGQNGDENRDENEDGNGDEKEEGVDLNFWQDDQSGAGYVYSAPGAFFVGGGSLRDERLTFLPTKPGQAFLTWARAEEMALEVTVSGQVSIEPALLVSDWDTDQGVTLYRLENGRRVREDAFPAKRPVIFTAQAEETYLLVAEMVAPPPRPEIAWYFGAGAPFDPSRLWIMLMNPQRKMAEAILTLTRPDGSIVRKEYSLKPTSRLSIPLDDIVPEAPISVVVEADQGVYAERTTYFAHDGHTTAGAQAPARTWYFAEGFTGGGFETWILLHNPHAAPTRTTISFAGEDGSIVKREYTLSPISRPSILVNQVLPNVSFSTVIEAERDILAERVVFFSGRRGVHGSIGASAPASTWYLPEGYTGPGFESWFLFYNASQNWANATITFMKDDGSTVVRRHRLRPTARFTLSANTIVPNAAFSTRVEADQPLVVERAVYFSDREGGHCSPGATKLAHTWYLPEGLTSQTDTFIMVMNPNSVRANVQVTIMKENGSTVTRHYLMKPTSRLTIRLNDLVPNARLATRIGADQPVAAERAMYLTGRKGTQLVWTAGMANIGMEER